MLNFGRRSNDVPDVNVIVRRADAVGLSLRHFYIVAHVLECQLTYSEIKSGFGVISTSLNVIGLP